MPQLGKFTFFTQFFWFCLVLFTFYIAMCHDEDGVLGISRILKLRNQLLSHRENKIRSKDPNSLADILRKGFSTGVSYMYSSLFEVSQWCKSVDLLGKRRKITFFSVRQASFSLTIFLKQIVHSVHSIDRYCKNQLIKMKKKNAALCICFLKSFTLLLKSQGLGAWALTWSPLCFIFFDLMDFILSTMDGVPLSFLEDGSSGSSSSKGPLFDLNLPPQIDSEEPLFDLNLPPQPDPEPAPLEPSSGEEERRERELRASKEYKAVERHNERRDTHIKEICQRAKEIAQDWGFSPDKCDAVEDAAYFVALKAEELDEDKQLPFLRRARRSLENRNSQTWRHILDEVKRWRR